jgi:Fe-S-cluster-containing hydrogenase component 2
LTVTYRVENGCVICGTCVTVCPQQIITLDRDGAHIDEEQCIGCGTCYENCASEAIVRVSQSIGEQR